MSAALAERHFDAVLVDDHVRLMDEVCATLSEDELRGLIEEIAQEVAGFRDSLAEVQGEKTSFDRDGFVEVSLEEAQRIRRLRPSQQQRRRRFVAFRG